MAPLAILLWFNNLQLVGHLVFPRKKNPLADQFFSSLLGYCGKSVFRWRHSPSGWKPLSIMRQLRHEFQRLRKNSLGFWGEVS